MWNIGKSSANLDSQISFAYSISDGSVDWISLFLCWVLEMSICINKHYKCAKWRAVMWPSMQSAAQCNLIRMNLGLPNEKGYPPLLKTKIAFIVSKRSTNQKFSVFVHHKCYHLPLYWATFVKWLKCVIEGNFKQHKEIDSHFVTKVVLYFICLLWVDITEKMIRYWMWGMVFLNGSVDKMGVWMVSCFCRTDRAAFWGVTYAAGVGPVIECTYFLITCIISNFESNHIEIECWNI